MHISYLWLFDCSGFPINWHLRADLNMWHCGCPYPIIRARHLWSIGKTFAARMEKIIEGFKGYKPTDEEKKVVIYFFRGWWCSWWAIAREIWQAEGYLQFSLVVLAQIFFVRHQNAIRSHILVRTFTPEGNPWPRRLLATSNVCFVSLFLTSQPLALGLHTLLHITLAAIAWKNCFH